MSNTKIILREKIEGLGAEADVVQVRHGYARNFLIPKGKAFEATRGNLRQIESLKAARAKREAEELNAAEKLASKVKRTKINLELATGETGKAFGSITVIDLVKAIEEQAGETIDRHAIELSKPIKTTGSFDVPVKLHPDVSFDLRVRVDAKGAAEPEGEE
ncbi:MAG: 50S ribosomal protein L9 [Verrucomicrobiota bacterium]